MQADNGKARGKIEGGEIEQSGQVVKLKEADESVMLWKFVVKWRAQKVS